MARIVVLASLAESLIHFRGPLLKEMVSKGHQVIGCAPDAPDNVISTLQEMGVAYQNVRLQRVGMSPLQDALTLLDLFRIYRRIKPDIVLSYTIKPVVYGSLAAKLAKVPQVFSIITGLGYTFSVSGFKGRLVGGIARALYRVALACNKHVFFQNPDDLELFLDENIITDRNKTVLINGSGIDVDAYKTASYPDELSFLLIARLLKAKGIYEYVAAAEIIKKKHPDIKFKIVGWIDKYNPDSISEKELQTWIDKGTVVYFGKLSNVCPAIADSSVYILPSYREGTPRTVLEAMAMGRPIITTDAPGCRETVIDGENGFLVPIKAINELVEAIEYFIRQPDMVKNMGKVSRTIAEEKYDVRRVNKDIMQAMNLVPDTVNNDQLKGNAG